MVVIAGCYWEKLWETHGRGQQVRAGVNTSGCSHSLSLAGPGELELVVPPPLQPPWASQGVCAGVCSLKFSTGRCSPVVLCQLHRGIDDGICLLLGYSEQKLIWGMLNKGRVGFPSWMKSQVWTGSSEWAQLRCWGREYFSLHHWVYLPVCLL